MQGGFGEQKQNAKGAKVYAKGAEGCEDVE
jgi:hypothetical protein